MTYRRGRKRGRSPSRTTTLSRVDRSFGVVVFRFRHQCCSGLDGDFDIDYEYQHRHLRQSFAGGGAIERIMMVEY